MVKLNFIVDKPNIKHKPSTFTKKYSVWWKVIKISCSRSSIVHFCFSQQLVTDNSWFYWRCWHQRADGGDAGDCADPGLLRRLLRSGRLPYQGKIDSRQKKSMKMHRFSSKFLKIIFPPCLIPTPPPLSFFLRLPFKVQFGLTIFLLIKC